MPLEILFKLIHSDKLLPMIKYNPGRERENIYRFFTDNVVATNGKQIPYLYTTYKNKKGKIVKLSKLMARKKRVSFYIEYNEQDVKYTLLCEFETNGNITIKLQHGTALDISTIEDVIKNAINEPILEKIKNYLEQSGYTFQLFTSFDDKNIEFKKIEFLALLEIKKNIHLKNYLGCLSGVFTVIDGDLTGDKEEIKLLYKRVSNYNKLNSVESFITELSKADESPPEIIKQLMGNFSMPEETATKQYADWGSQVATEANLFENKSITIRTNTGFPVSITRDNSNFKTSILINSINDIRYIQYMVIYIDTMLRLIIDKKSTNIPQKDITKICKGRAIKDITVETDVKAVQIEFSSDKKEEFFSFFGEQEDSMNKEEEEVDFEGITFEEDIGSPSESGTPSSTKEIRLWRHNIWR